MKFLKNKKGSQLVEKILMTAFAVAGGGAVVVYGSNILTNAKNTEITGILGNGSGMTQEQLNTHFDDNDYTIHLTAQEVNSKSFSNLVSTIEGIENMQPYDWLNGSSVVVGEKNFYLEEIVTGTENDYHIWYYCDSNPGYDISIGKTWFYHSGFYDFMKTGIIYMSERTSDPYEFISMDENFIWHTNNEDFYSLIKPALIADLS